MKKVFSLILTVILTMHSYSSYAKNESSVSQDMAKVGEILRDIYPILLNSSDAPLSKNDANKVNTRIDSIIKHISHADSSMLKKTTAFNISIETLQHHLKSIQVAVEKERFEYAKYLLRSVTKVCTDCHIRDTKESKITPSLLWDSYVFSKDIADYNYITRNYQQALKMYQSQISSANATDYTSYETLQRILVIYLQVYRDPKSAKNYFSGIINHERIQPSAKLEIKHWLQGIDLIIDAKLLKHDADYSSLKRYIQEYVINDDENEDNYKILSDEKTPIIIWIRSLIHEYLITQATDNETPILLFWLATIDREVNFDLYYSLADLYLKHCIIEYPQHPYAQKCYNLYEDYITFYSTGSSGTTLSLEHKRELKNLRSYLKK